MFHCLNHRLGHYLLLLGAGAALTLPNLGAASLWHYVQRWPGVSYADLAEDLSSRGDFGVAPVQMERLQVRDTPERELTASIRDSLARQLDTT